MKLSRTVIRQTKKGSKLRSEFHLDIPVWDIAVIGALVLSLVAGEPSLFVIALENLNACGR